MQKDSFDTTSSLKKRFVSSKKEVFFNCPYTGCGRKFQSKSGLNGHIQRRHQLNDSSALGKENSIFPQEEEKKVSIRRPQTAVQKSESLAEKEERLAQKLKALQKLEQEVLQMDSRPATAASSRMASTTSGFYQDKSRITENMVRRAQFIDFQNIDELTVLTLRDLGLTEFRNERDLDFEKLCNVTSLTLSHNRIMDVEDIGLNFSQLLQLNLNFNRIQDITPLKHCEQLQRLWLSSNQIMIIDCLSSLTQLRTLSLFHNQIHSPEDTLDTLGELQKLEELSLDHNPCIFKDPGLKHSLIYKLELINYDDERLTDFDRQLANQYVKDNGLSAALAKRNAPHLKIREIGGDRGPKKTSSKRRIAADQEYSVDFVPAGKKTSVRFDTQDYLGDEDLQGEILKLKQENEDLKFKLYKWEDYQELKEENQKLKIEVSNLYILEQENEDLRQEVKELKKLSSSEKRERLEEQNVQLLAECGKLRIKYQNLQLAYEKLDMVKWEEKLAAIQKVRQQDRVHQANHLKHLEFDFVARPQTSAGPLKEKYQRPSTAAMMGVNAIDQEEEMELLDQQMRDLLKRNQKNLAQLHQEFKSLSLVNDQPTFRIRQSKGRSLTGGTGNALQNINK